ncbi:MAG: alpha-L-rhamnosidase [Ruminococcaceae bacterium]|nr:alpha-L-rhamnosidase [Oscillospiraceae bacterium]
MEFNSTWITTKDFENLKPIDIFHKQVNNKKLEETAFYNYHAHFIKEFYVDETGNYEIKISADDFYKLYINGEFVCQGVAPAYFDSYNYNETDISKFLNKGKNTVAVHVFYQGLINRATNSGDNRMGLIADIFCDGKFVFGTDESWKCERTTEYSGDTTPYLTQFREDIDFRKKNASWKMDTDSGNYENARIFRFADWKFKENPVPTVDVYKALPKETVKKDDNIYFYDFGNEITGQVYFKAKGFRGQTVIVKCGEELNDDGSIRYKMRCNCNYYDICTLSGAEDEFEFFDYKGFRYVQIEANGNLPFDPNEVCVIVRHHKFEEKCRIKSDVPYLEDIWNICRNSLKYSVQEGYLDCPTREKGQYSGDFTTIGFSHLYLTKDKEMYKKTLFDFADSARVCKGLMAVAPGSVMQEIAEFSLEYPLQVLTYYKLTKDIDALKQLYPTVKGLIEYFKQYERYDGLIENIGEKWNIIDWPMNLRDGYCVGGVDNGQPVKLHNVVNAFYIYAVQCMEEMENILGLTAENKSSKLKEAFVNTFYNKETKLFCDDEEHTHSALHSNTFPLLLDFAPSEAKENMVEFIMEKGLVCGVHFAYYVLKALGKAGAYDKEFELMMNDGEHSWINMVREGATTCFEAWGKNQKWNTSLCHPWASTPIIILIEDILKITHEEFMTGGNYTKDVELNGNIYQIEIIVDGE